MLAIYKRELKSYFSSMIGYVFIAGVLIFIGLYFRAYNLEVGHPSFSMALYSVAFIFTIAIPILTMKCFAEERKAKTDQMLLTAPVSVTSVVFGKYLSMMTVAAIPLLVSCVFPLIIAMNGNANLASDYATIFAFFCMTAVYVAIGMFISSLTENQIISAVLTLVVLLILYLWEGILEHIPTEAFGSFLGMLIMFAAAVLIFYFVSKNKPLSYVIAFVGAVVMLALYIVKPALYNGLLYNILSSFFLQEVLTKFVGYSVFDIKGLIMYVSLAALFVFLTIQSIQKRRWS